VGLEKGYPLTINGIYDPLGPDPNLGKKNDYLLPEHSLIVRPSRE